MVEMIDTILSAWLRRAETAAFAVLVGISICWAVVSLTWPFGWDQGIFAWIGDAIVRGEMPYRDAWDIKGPLVYGVYAIAQLLFGREPWAIRLLELPILTGGAIVLATVVARLTTNRIGRWTAVLYVLYFASNRYWHTAQPDAWVGILVLVGLWPLLAANEQGTLRSLAIAAFAIGTCVLVKPIYAAFLVTLVPAIVARFRTAGLRAGWSIAVVSIGFAAPIIMASVWFLARGAGSELYDTYVRYPIEVYAGDSAQPLATRLREFKRTLLADPTTLVCVPLGGLGLLALWRQSRTRASVLLSWFLVGLALIVVQGRFWQYHWTTIYPPVFIAQALGFMALMRMGGKVEWTISAAGDARVFGAMLLSVLAFNGAQKPATDFIRMLDHERGKLSEDDYQEFFDESRYDVQAAEFIREHTQPSDRIAIWGWNTAILFYSGRCSASRFGFSMPLLMDENPRRRDSYRDEFMSALRTQPPAYVVLSPTRLSSLEVPGIDPLELGEFPEFKAWLDLNCTRDVEIGDLILYRLATDSPGR